jgi:hypothetical protein
MTNLKTKYTELSTIYNRNLKVIKTQLNSKQLAELKTKYNCTEDSQLAKVTMLRGIKL